MMPGRQLVLDGLHNIRDLGGLAQSDGGTTRFGALYRGCAMAELTPKGRAALAARGITTLIDLRSARERAAHPTRLSALPGITDLHVPLFDALAPVYKMANSSRGFSLTARYGAALERAGPRFAEAIAALAAAGPGAALIHCTAGKDRTGLLSALLLRLAGVERQEIIADYHLSVTEGRPYIERLRRISQSRRTAPHLLSLMLDAPPAAMAEVLTLLEDRFGGARAYLASAGVSEDAMALAAGRFRG